MSNQILEQRASEDYPWGGMAEPYDAWKEEQMEEEDIMERIGKNLMEIGRIFAEIADDGYVRCHNCGAEMPRSEAWLITGDTDYYLCKNCYNE